MRSHELEDFAWDFGGYFRKVTKTKSNIWRRKKRLMATPTHKEGPGQSVQSPVSERRYQAIPLPDSYSLSDRGSSRVFSQNTMAGKPKNKQVRINRRDGAL